MLKRKFLLYFFLKGHAEFLANTAGRKNLKPSICPLASYPEHEWRALEVRLYYALKVYQKSTNQASHEIDLRPEDFSTLRKTVRNWNIQS